MTAMDEAIRWQVGVWDGISDRYTREIDQRFTAIVGHCVDLAALAPGESVLDLGTGTGSVAVAAAKAVGAGRVVGVDISPEMLRAARARTDDLGLGDIELREGRAEAVPASDGEFDVLIACLSYMYVIDRDVAAREAARVVRPGGRLVAAVWAGPDAADIVRFQQIAGSFAPAAPVAGVGPGALADVEPFLTQLARAGFAAKVTTETFEFRFADLESAWDVLASVTAASSTAEQVEQAKRAIRDAMWPDPSAPRVFANATRFVTAVRGA